MCKVEEGLELEAVLHSLVIPNSLPPSLQLAPLGSIITLGAGRLRLCLSNSLRVDFNLPILLFLSSLEGGRRRGLEEG